MEELILDVASNTVSEQGLGPQAAASLRKARALEGRGLSASTYAAVWAAMADFVSSALSQSKVHSLSGVARRGPGFAQVRRQAATGASPASNPTRFPPPLPFICRALLSPISVASPS